LCGQTFANNFTFSCIALILQFTSYRLLAHCCCYCYCSHFIYEYCKVNKSQSKPVLVQMHKIIGNQVGVPSLILIDGFNCCLMRLQYG
jgi:hypothetical protein